MIFEQMVLSPQKKKKSANYERISCNIKWSRFSLSYSQYVNDVMACGVIYIIDVHRYELDVNSAIPAPSYIFRTEISPDFFRKYPTYRGDVNNSTFFGVNNQLTSSNNYLQQQTASSLSSIAPHHQPRSIIPISASPSIQTISYSEARSLYPSLPRWKLCPGRRVAPYAGTTTTPTTTATTTTTTTTTSTPPLPLPPTPPPLLIATGNYRRALPPISSLLPSRFGPPSFQPSTFLPSAILQSEEETTITTTTTT